MWLLVRRAKTFIVGMFFVCALLVSFLCKLQVASAFGSVLLLTHPYPVSQESVATFTFISFFGSTECKLDDDAFAPCTYSYTTPTLEDGDHNFTAHEIGESDPDATVSFDWEINSLPTLDGGTNVSGDANTAIPINDLNVNDNGDDELTFKLSAPSGELALLSEVGLTFNGSHTGSILEFSGTRSDLNIAISSLVYTPSSTGVTTINVELAAVSGEQYDALNGHVYKIFYENPAFHWDQAAAAAEASSYGGATGYLATVTSQEENDFIESRLLSTAWLGGNDETTEGTWKWETDPDDVSTFWNGGIGGSTVGGSFADWIDQQPDNWVDEDCLTIYNNIASENWNDQNCGASVPYYVVEYGDADTLPYIANKEITVTVAATDIDADDDGLSNAIEDTGPNNGDANNDGIYDGTQANVSSQPGIHDRYIVIETGCAQNLNFQVGGESAEDADIAFDYPEGLIGFIGDSCGQPGSSVPVTLYFFGLSDIDDLVLRKWDPDSNAYTTISSAVLSKVTIGGELAVKTAYEVVDGGPLDTDGVADGNIVDPVGLGISMVGAPNTGLGGSHL